MNTLIKISHTKIQVNQLDFSVAYSNLTIDNGFNRQSNTLSLSCLCLFCNLIKNILHNLNAIKLIVLTGIFKIELDFNRIVNVLHFQIQFEFFLNHLTKA